MNSPEKIKFKRLIETDWLEDKEAKFALSVLNQIKDLDSTYAELVKMTASGDSSEPFIVVDGYSMLDHFTMATSIVDKISEVELSEDDLLNMRDVQL